MPQKYEEVTRHKKPDWLKVKLYGGPGYPQVGRIVKEHALNTICESGMCPNKAECWSMRTATFMILGDICTRSCRFCATATGKPLPPENDEPCRVARSVNRMGLRHCVITSVTRDDLPDHGAAHWARTIDSIRRENPDTTIEVLIPDLAGRTGLIDIVLAAGPDIAGHNLETVQRITPLIRSGADYHRSLGVISHISRSGRKAKSGLMVGLGESKEEVLTAMDDLAQAGCSILTIGQYLRPTMRHTEVAEYVSPDIFAWYAQQALARGFAHVQSAPLVRSSYMAHEAMV